MAAGPEPDAILTPATEELAPEDVERLRDAVEAGQLKRAALPEPVKGRWEEVAAQAVRKRLAVAVRIPEGAGLPIEREGDLVGAFDVFGTNRSGIERKLGRVEAFSTATELAGAFVDEAPELGADALREELRKHARRLAALDPRELSHKRKGVDHRIYVEFRDRVLPLAWDNLVSAVALERLGDFVRKVVATYDDLRAGDDDTPNPELAALAEEARGLVGPKEAPSGDADPNA